MGEIFSFLQKGFIVTCSQPFLHSGARTFFLRESTLFIAFARGYNLLSRVSFKNKAASFYTTIEPDSLKTVISLFLSNEISVSPHSGKNSMSFSSKACKGIRAGLCKHGKVSMRETRTLKDKLT